MAPILIVYASRTGFTARFALALARTLHATVLEAHFVTATDLRNCRLLLYGGHLARNQVSGWPAFCRRFRSVLPAHVLLFGTGVKPRQFVSFAKVKQTHAARCGMAPEWFYFPGIIDVGQLPLGIRLQVAWAKRRYSAVSPESLTTTLAPCLHAVAKLV